MLLLRGFAFSCLWVFGLRQLEQTEMSVTGLTDKSGQIPCKVSLPDFGNAYIHWYRQKTNQELEYLLYFKTSYHQLFLDGKNKKIEAGKDFLTSTSTLKVNFLKKEDEATYYCAAWILMATPIIATLEKRRVCEISLEGNLQTLGRHKTFQWNPSQLSKRVPKWFSTTKLKRAHVFVEALSSVKKSSWIMVFGSGTKLRVIPSGKLLGSDISPKPTIFLPSVAETNHDKAGTYLCLLEKFFPDVIRVYWKKKNGDQILKSQEGNTMKTGDTYMKLSWLTVPEDSMDKEHRCIVQHESNKRGHQEVLFPPIKKEAALKTENDVTTIKVNPRESASKWENGNNSADMEACKEEIKDVLQLQLTNTSAFYNYLILFFKSLVHLAFVVFCLLRRRTAVPCSGPSS
ncbi:uncharacterized protein LOC110553994 [Meriones unguiculatus]|uniref:uncharacterized protein LOC110553994 n=1 Tax=Meriones unguiculatus TaxID=10047 RepID=UPI00293F7664|nr:uncharacterized protein LOC110553994 [Meriones unguiculatus]